MRAHLGRASVLASREQGVMRNVITLSGDDGNRRMWPVGPRHISPGQRPGFVVEYINRALHGHDNQSVVVVMPLQGIGVGASQTQGVALGYHVEPRCGTMGGLALHPKLEAISMATARSPFAKALRRGNRGRSSSGCGKSPTRALEHRQGVKCANAAPPPPRLDQRRSPHPEFPSPDGIRRAVPR